MGGHGGDAEDDRLDLGLTGLRVGHITADQFAAGHELAVLVVAGLQPQPLGQRPWVGLVKHRHDAGAGHRHPLGGHAEDGDRLGQPVLAHELVALRQRLQALGHGLQRVGQQRRQRAEIGHALPALDQRRQVQAGGEGRRGGKGTQQDQAAAQ
ncbi:hypothetical protein G6F35_009617 [Rhizopus arrhizus]|nr:hypothetical protein G6F35_009617 [Rhizopus arrhizus]